MGKNNRNKSALPKSSQLNTKYSVHSKEMEQADNTSSITDNDMLSNQQELDQTEYFQSQKEMLEMNSEETIAKEKAAINERFIQLEKMELEARNGFSKLFEESFADAINQLKTREQNATEAWKKIEAEKVLLQQREQNVQQSEIKRDNGFQDERKKFEDELEEKRKFFSHDITNKRIARLDELEKEIEIERKKRLQLLSNEIDRIRTDFENEVAQQKSNLKIKEEKLSKREQDVEGLEFLQDKAKRRLERLDVERKTIKEEIEQGIIERKQSFENEKSALNDEIARLRESIKTSSALTSNFEELKHKLGDEDPAAVLLKLKTYEEEIKKLRDDLATRPTQEMQVAFDRLKKEQESLEQACNSLSDENVRLKKNAQEQSQLEMKISDLEVENKSYKQRFESVDADNNRLMEELKRLQSAYVRESDFEKRKINIEKPYIEKKLPRSLGKQNELPKLLKNPEWKGESDKCSRFLAGSSSNKFSEIEYLNNISNSCIDYGLNFPRRILHAFHTALKTSEWSPVTVLAGVSGTGKSELPRLYSHFGGINFLSLSVQPNWDSQESMLGFFNSIDNEFDAQEVLRFLVQSQKEQTRENPFGLQDTMSLILMDEMNLAHVELYFAEFLSKLELRRGLKGDSIPSLPVKLGVGSDFIYPLSLGRNVLWAGTMNQDETTKSLSDKVLDRGIVINFPRPTTLERRRQLKPLGEQAPLLSRKLWESWWCRESKFNDDQILPFKGFIEEMNTSLSKVGRALGHRVWQSIEYYMSNYPDVLEAQRNNDDSSLVKAMKVAFEDQLVQKVMPKLRGIETRGKSKSDCLDKIRTQLVNEDYTIIDDFDLACEFGYGQFIWNSANYLKDDEGVNGQENAEN